MSMKETTHQINLALRTAAGHARAATDVLAAAEGTYEMKMKSAGASVWEAWTLAVRAQPEFEGRKLDDKALVRIYESSKPRPWWDKHLSTVKVEGKPANRDWAKRTMQWHTDPDAARARRLKNAAVHAKKRKEIKEKQEAWGSRQPQAGGREPTTAEMREFAAAVAKEKWGVELPQPEASAHRNEIDRLVIRIRQAVSRMSDDQQLAEAVAMLRLAAEGVEAL